ncbi:MAG: metallophosphoesterase [Rhodoferax sp.]|nr:metallophosphoesterase [Rhodoferax sp.]
MSITPVLLVSLLLHTLVGWRLAPDIAAWSHSLGMGLAVGLLLSALAMPAGFFARQLARPRLAQVLGWAGFVCMGLFSSLFVLTLLRELLLLAVGVAGWLLATNPPTLAQLRTHSALAVPLVALVITAWGYVNARRTAAVVRVEVPIAGLDDALHGFTVAQISDIHVGPTIRSRYLRHIVAKVNGLGADLVAITGDLVDGSVRDLGRHVAPLQDLVSTHGTFFVTGNHEYYSGVDGWTAALRGLGIQVLMNEHVVIHHGGGPLHASGAAMVVAGVTDFNAHHFDKSHQSDPHLALADAPGHAVFKLLLAHQPRSAPAAAQAGFDLQLSGHTHGGQFWPWNHFVPLQQPFTAGLHRLQALWVYTSRGTGYWGPPKRFGAPSEITHLRLVRATPSVWTT